MVFVKVRETYDLKTVQNKMTVIGIHTPAPGIIAKNFPGLLMQCKAYRPVSCDVRLACASTMPMDPLNVGTETGDVAPEDLFNPILYKAISNIGMSQIEARIQTFNVNPTTADISGNTSIIDADGLTSETDEFSIYYGLLSDAHGWKHANPQAGLEMTNLKPYVFEMLYNVGDNSSGAATEFSGVAADGTPVFNATASIRGNAKPIPFINTTSYASAVGQNPGFPVGSPNVSTSIPWINAMCGVILVPPSRLHTLYYRMVVEWTIEFSAIRTLSEITNWSGLAAIGSDTHFTNYSYSAAKEALTGSSETVMEKTSAMVDSNVDITKVM